MRAKTLSNLIILLLTAALASAATRHVPDQYPNIQAAIDDCNDGDTVIIAPGTHTGPGNRDIDFKGKPITVRSTDPNDPDTVAETIIDCQNAGRGFIFHNNEGPGSAIKGLTVRNGLAGLTNVNPDEPMDKIRGGAIFAINSSPTIVACHILNNRAGSDGGGMYCRGGNVTITACTFSQNNARSGGGIYCDGSAMISDCTIRMNIVRFHGGGIFCSGHVVIIVHSEIVDNHCQGSQTARYRVGGGVYSNNNATLAITDSVIAGNTAGCDGAMFCLGSTVRMEDCMISDNSASGYTAGVRFQRGSSLIRNCTFARNDSAGWTGGVMLSESGDLVITNCIFWDNISPKGRNIVLSGGTASVSHSCVAGGRESVYGKERILHWDNNINTDPGFVNPDEGDFHLSPGSPCIEGGDPCYAALEETDIDGDPRIIGRRVDMGADEFVFKTPYIGVPPGPVVFNAIQGHANPEPVILSIHNAGIGTLSWCITENCRWLQVNPITGTATSETDEFTLAVDTIGMLSGVYDCNLVISDPNASNSPVILPVRLDLIGPMIEVSSNRFDFEAGKENPTPPGQILSIQNTSAGTLDWRIIAPNNCNWLSIYPLAGQSAGEVNEVMLSVDAAGLEYGFYACELTITDPNAANSPRIVEVHLHIGFEPGRLYVPGEYPNIQSAIDWALPGDVVVVAPGTYTGTGNRDIDFLGKPITVRSIDPNDPEIVASTIIDCNAGPDDRHRGFNFKTGEDANSVLAGLTIINGYAYDGGGCYISRGNPTISNCIITGNSASYQGGAIHCSESNAVVTNCTITGNQCLGGGRGGSYGGGIYCSYGSLIITNCTITDNRTGFGGGIYLYRSNPIIGNCAFSANSAGDGGAISCKNSDVHITNCTFAGNSTSDLGGAIYNESSDTTITNCTFAGNSGDRGGAFAELGSVSTVTNSIFWQNTPSDIYAHDGAPAVTYCNILEGFGGVGNIDLDPLFVDPGYWDSNGSPGDSDDDFWVDGDYHLKSQGWRWDTQREVWTWDDVTSRCIDAGDPNLPLGDEPLSVPLDPNNEWGQNMRINMGAFGGTQQASIPPLGWAIPTDYNNDGIADFTDFAFWSQNHGYTTLESPAEPNSAPALNAAELALFADRWLDRTTWFGTLPLPTAAWNPKPPDGAIGINMHPMLSWQPGAGATSHDVYFGPTDPPAFQANQTETTFYPDYLSEETTYYWRIDEVNPDGKTTGPLWRFTTGTGGKVRCFPADTIVWVDGEMTEICKVSAGSMVDKPAVTQTIAGMRKAVCGHEIEGVDVHDECGTWDRYDITLENGNSLTVADSHYFLLYSGKWLSVENLASGSELATLEGPATIKSVQKSTSSGAVYNLRIKDGQRYLVGKDGIIVRDW